MAMSGDTAYALAKSYVKKTAEGMGAVKGKDGFSPVIREINYEPDANYQLEIITANQTFTTPNLLGEKGRDGFTPTIGLNKNWYINGEDTGERAVGKDGENGEDGTDGFSPIISEMQSNTEDDYRLKIITENDEFITPNLKAKNGRDGITPMIDKKTNHWIIGNLDTEVSAKGEDGFSPSIEVYKNTSSEYVLKIINKYSTYNTPNLKTIISSTMDPIEIKMYEDLEGKPRINGVELNGNMSFGDLGLNEELKEEGYIKESDFPTYGEVMEILNEDEVVA